MNRFRFLLLVACPLALATPPVMAQVVVGGGRDPVKPIVIKPPPERNPRKGNLSSLPLSQTLKLHLADLPDGSYVADVDGHGRPLSFHNTMTFVINGKGFDTYRVNESRVSLFVDGQSAGLAVKIMNWNDTRITGQISATQKVIAADTSKARLKVQISRPDHEWLSLVIDGVHFDAPN